MAEPLHDKKYEIFRQMLSAARIAKGVQQGEVAELVNKHQSYVSKSENGGRRIDFTEFVEFADVLEIDIDAFLIEYRERIANVAPTAIQSAMTPQQLSRGPKRIRKTKRTTGQ
jgi:transcriptional regulator with XRE-family HTH domain